MRGEGQAREGRFIVAQVAFPGDKMKTSSVPLTAGRRDGPVTGLGTHIPQEFLPKADPERPAPPSEPSLGPVGISGISRALEGK